MPSPARICHAFTVIIRDPKELAEEVALFSFFSPASSVGGASPASPHCGQLGRYLHAMPFKCLPRHSRPRHPGGLALP